MKKLQYNSPVILTFFLLSLGILLLDWLTSGWTTLHAFCVYRSSLADPLFYVRLFGHVLGHADFDHFLGNMLLLLVIGPPLEEKYGSRTLLAGILLTAGVSGILQCVFFPGSALLGASGIVFMLIMLASLAGMKDGRIPLTLILAAVLYLGQEAYAMVALREPSMGPVFGIKGGAAGGGYAQVVPMEDINLHFTGDFHAIGAANNLLAAMLDNHIQQGNALGIDVKRITWRRCVDMNDRQLRSIVDGLGGRMQGVPREDGFDITVASEVMAVLCLASPR